MVTTLVINPAHLDALKLKKDVAETKQTVESEAKTILITRTVKKPARKKAPPKKVPSSRTVTIAVALLIVVVGGLLYRMFIYTPKPPVGYVALNIQPWAEIAKIVNVEGEEVNDLIKSGVRIVTPCKLSQNLFKKSGFCAACG